MAARIVATLFGSAIGMGYLAYQVYVFYRENVAAGQYENNYDSRDTRSREYSQRCRRCEERILGESVTLRCGHLYHQDCLRSEVQRSGFLRCSCGEGISTMQARMLGLRIERDCVICDGRDSEDRFITLSCSHNFHISCLCSYIVIRGEQMCTRCKQSLNRGEREMLTRKMKEVIKAVRGDRALQWCGDGQASREAFPGPPSRNQHRFTRPAPSQEQRRACKSCTLCHENIGNRTDCVQLSCGHSFHSDCAVVEIVRQRVEETVSEHKCFERSCIKRITEDEVMRALRQSNLPLKLE